MFEKVVDAKNESSNRRRFFRKLVGLAAMVGIGGASLAGSTRKVYAADGDNLKIGQANSGSSVTSLTASPEGGEVTAFKVTTTSASLFSKAIYGIATASTGSNYGVYGQSDAVDGTGIYAYASANTGINFGVQGYSGSIDGRGVYGYVGSYTGTTYGVYGQSSSESGISIIGKAGAAGAKPIVARGHSGQTANLQEWQNTSGTPLSVISKDGYLGVGTTTPTACIHGINTGGSYGIWGESGSLSGTGVYGLATINSGTTYGVYGQSNSESGRGVYGYATRQSGTTYGVYGKSDSVSGTGVSGWASAITGVASGVIGVSGSVNGRGVHGMTISDTGINYGVLGESNSVEGTGVQGYAFASTGTTYGVYGEAFSISGIGVIGVAGGTTVKPMVARGAGSQTASLQEWQDYSSKALSVISKDGYLGIGTNSPSTAVHVKSSSSNPAIRIENENAFVGEFIYCYSSGSHIPFFSGRRARGTTASPSAVQTDDILMRYGGSGYGTSGFPGGNRAILEFRAAQTWTDGAQGTYITFSTTPNDSIITAERMRITSDGAILPPSDNTGSLGKEGQKWNLVRATTVTQGDLVYENGVRSTEEGEGIAFYNPKGTKIAVLDSEGNFHIKGDLIKDL